MVARRVGADSASGFFICQRVNGVARAAKFERAHFLQVLAFEKYLRAHLSIQTFIG
jgi:hypothetical protein